MKQQYFVTLIIPDRRGLNNLRAFDLDFFQQTLKTTDKKTYTIQGLLSLEEIGEMVDRGYRVLVEESASRRSRAPLEVVEFDEWLKSMNETLKK